MFEKFRSARSGAEIKNAFDAANSVEQGKALEHSINQNAALIEGAAALRQDARDAGAIADDLRRRLDTDSEQADDIIAELRREKLQAIRERNAAIEKANYYENLLSQPMNAIAASHPGFKATYEQQQVVFDGWRQSQIVWKEQALIYGVEKLSLTRSSVIADFRATEKAFIDNPVSRFPRQDNDSAEARQD